MNTANTVDNGKRKFHVPSYKSNQTYSTILVLFTVTLWSFLSLLTIKLRHIPPFLLLGITLTIAGIFSLPLIKTWKVPLLIFVVGVTGIFGNLFFYYLAFQLAPAVEVNLINYLWPMMIVIMSPLFLKGFRLRYWHILGVLFGLFGTFLIIAAGKTSFSANYFWGYLSALLGALFWAVYSLLIKRLPDFHPGAVGGFSLAAGVLSLLVFWIQYLHGTTFPHLQMTDSLYLLLIGLGPIGLANLTWKKAVQNGDPRVFGSLSYLTPLLSTICLVIFGHQTITLTVIIAMFLIIFGSLLGGMKLG